MADFEITNFSMTKNKVALGDQVVVTFTLKNTIAKGTKTKYVGATLYAKANGADDYSLYVDTSPRDNSAVIAYGKSKTLSLAFDLNPLSDSDAGYAALESELNADPAKRALPLLLQITALYSESDGDEYAAGFRYEIPGGYVLRSYCKPTIPSFKMKRVAENPKTGAREESEEGEIARMELTLLPTGAEDDYQKFFRATLYYAQDTQADTNSDSIDFTEIIGMQTVADLLPEFSNGSDWNFLVVFGDEYESVSARADLFRAFANMHLSGKAKGGVSLGGFSSSTDDEPKFESHYPAYLYGGVKQIGEGWIPLTPENGSTPAEYGGGELRCRKIENKCIVAGSMLVRPGGSTIKLAKLPDEFAPAASVFSLNACSGSRVARIAVHGPDDEYPGYLALSWVCNIAGDQAGMKYTGDAIWVQCSIEYWVD